MRIRRFPVVFLFVLGLTASLAGRLAADGVAYRVADLRTVPLPEGYFSSYDVAALPGGLLLPVPFPGLGWEPFLTSGTAADMSLVRNIAPGEWSSNSWTIGVLGGVALLRAWDPGTGEELWRTDGTPAGTWRVADIAPGPTDSSPRAVASTGGVLYFSAWDAAHGRELWRTDGTAAGTWLVADLVAGAEDGICGTDHGAARGGRVYFCGVDAVFERQLWVSDGTTAGTDRLTSVSTSWGGLSPDQFVAGAGAVYFSGIDDPHGRELWRSDGTAPGTGLVADLRAGPYGSYPVPWSELGPFLVFAAFDVPGTFAHLLRTDGTAAGTGRIVSTSVSAEWVNFDGGGRIGDRIVFAAHDALGSEPWVTDATPAGTQQLADIAAGAADSLSGWGSVRGHDGLYFCASNAAYESSFWRTDGTAAGTVAVSAIDECHRIEAGAAAPSRTLLQSYWWDYCGPHDECDYWELWTTDGTAAGTEPFWPDRPDLSPSSPEDLVARQGGILFGASSDAGAGWYHGYLWASDGTEEGTAMMTTPEGHALEYWGDAAPLPDGEVALTGHAYVRSWTTLWRTDGDGLLSLDGGGSLFSAMGELTRSDSAVFFPTWNDVSYELWRTDGTAGGTWRVDVQGGRRGFRRVEELADVFGRLWFLGETDAYGVELWESDGTAAGTIGHDLTPGPDPASTWPLQITALAESTGSLVFRTPEDYYFDSLWSYTPGDVEKIFLKTISNDSYQFDDAPLAVLDGELYFFDVDAVGARTLWKSDGTTAGTQLLAPVGPARVQENRVAEIVPFAGQVFFQACDATSGCEPWTTDGTPEGTRRFSDLDPGQRSSLPTSLAPIGDRLYFSACRAATGCEPWLTDGTPAGTHRLANIAPGVAGSASHAFTRSGDLVFFAADDTTGTELWAMPIELFYDGFETGDVSRWSGVGEP